MQLSGVLTWEFRWIKATTVTPIWRVSTSSRLIAIVWDKGRLVFSISKPIHSVISAREAAWRYNSSSASRESLITCSSSVPTGRFSVHGHRACMQIHRPRRMQYPSSSAAHSEDSDGWGMNNAVEKLPSSRSQKLGNQNLLTSRASTTEGSLKPLKVTLDTPGKLSRCSLPRNAHWVALYC